MNFIPTQNNTNQKIKEQQYILDQNTVSRGRIQTSMPSLKYTSPQHSTENKNIRIKGIDKLSPNQFTKVQTSISNNKYQGERENNIFMKPNDNQYNEPINHRISNMSIRYLSLIKKDKIGNNTRDHSSFMRNKYPNAVRNQHPYFVDQKNSFSKNQLIDNRNNSLNKPYSIANTNNYVDSINYQKTSENLKTSDVQQQRLSNSPQRSSLIKQKCQPFDIVDTNRISTAQTISEVLNQHWQTVWQPIIPKYLLQLFPQMVQVYLGNRNLVLGILVDYHRTMKLPLQALFIATNIFDRYYAAKEAYKEDLAVIKTGIFSLSAMTEIGVACLYVSHKLQKFKVYHISSWIKHLTVQNAPLLFYALPNICLPPLNSHQNTLNDQQQNSRELKEFKVIEEKQKLLRLILTLEGQILCLLNFNLWRVTLFDVLMAVQSSTNNCQLLKTQISMETLSIVSSIEINKSQRFMSEQQFYFCQYLLELSIFCDFSKIPENQNQIYLLQIALGIIQLSMYFFGQRKDSNKSSKQRMLELIKKVYSVNRIHTYGEIEESWSKFNDPEKKFKRIKCISNQLFKMIISQKPQHLLKIVSKYSKPQHMKVSCYNFQIRKEKPHKHDQNCSAQMQSIIISPPGLNCKGSLSLQNQIEWSKRIKSSYLSTGHINTQGQTVSPTLFNSDASYL